VPKATSRGNHRTGRGAPRGRSRGHVLGAALSNIEVIRDIPDFERAPAVDLRTRRLAILSDIAARLLASGDPDTEVLPPLFESVAMFGVDTMFSYATRPDDQLRLAFHAGVPAAVAAEVAHLLPGQAVCGTVAQHETAMHVPAVQESDEPHVGFVRRIGLRAYACEPLLAGELLLGTLSFGSRTRDSFDADDLAFFRAVAHLVAVARDRVRTERALLDSQARLRDALAAGRLGAWERDLLTDAMKASAQHKANFGLPPEAEFTYEMAKAMRHPDDRAKMEAALRRAIQDGVPYDIETRVIWPDGSCHWLMARGEIVRDEAGRPSRMIGFTMDVTERRRAESLNERLGRIVEDSVSEAYVFDAETLRFLQVNRGARENLGYTMEELQALTALDLKPEFTRESFEALVAPLRKGEVERLDFETVQRRKDGSLYDIAIRLQLMRDEPVFFAAIQDITERKQADARLKLLAQEVDHRANNLLAVIQAVVRLTRAGTVRDFVDAVQGRLVALARAHRLTADSRWAGADLETLVDEETAAYRNGDEARVRIRGPAIALSASAAQSIAMAVHELATNAVKYGALSVPEGRIDIAWTCGPDGLALIWTESGGPPVVEPTSRGFGTGVIDGTIRQQLKGTMRFDWRREGLVCEMAVPRDRLDPRPQD
jgi:PAS domain S-box-containing protein